MVKVGGVRVEPSLVEDAIRESPGVTDAAVIPIRVAGADLRPAVLVVIRPESSISVVHIKDAVRRTVSAASVPARVVLTTEALPLITSGKLNHQAISEILGPASRSGT
jgi:acyl-coenzyme A synthetase/AMP-(fatty) acid ligase